MKLEHLLLHFVLFRSEAGQKDTMLYGPFDSNIIYYGTFCCVEEGRKIE